MEIKDVLIGALAIKQSKALEMSPHIEDACREFDIRTPLRIALFLAHTYYETQGFTRFVENGNYSAKRLRQVFPKYFPNMTIANQYARRPKKIFSRTYANRYGNGSETSGDGDKYKGQSPIHLTFRDNYIDAGKELGIDLENNPQLARQYDVGFRIAAYYFKSRGILELADQGDFNALMKQLEEGEEVVPPSRNVWHSTKKIQGGYRGYKDRLAVYQKIIKFYHQDLKVGGEYKSWFKSRRLWSVVPTVIGAASTTEEGKEFIVEDVVEPVSSMVKDLQGADSPPTTDTLSTTVEVVKQINESGVIEMVNNNGLIWVGLAFSIALLIYSWKDDRNWGRT